MTAQFEIKWVDRGLEPQCAPNPDYPEGRDIVGGNGCKIDFPYPAKRCGIYVIKCKTCGLTFAITTAGRPDDPRSLQVDCVSSMPVAGNA